jgi:predicted polyphosphate/ATP-dependent NAD kinase
MTKPRRRKLKIGFLINPIAGMGGRVGLKGTDGVLAEALKLGAKPVAINRAKEALDRFVELVQNQIGNNPKLTIEVDWLTCDGNMGFEVLKSTGITDLENHNLKILYYPENIKNTTDMDTKTACNGFLSENVNLILFCGGDGTARDIYSVVEDKIPILGIPSGVKMHSGVFATHTNVVADLLLDYIKGEMDVADSEILDLDEDQYRAGVWNIRLFGVAKTPHDPSLIQRGKHLVESASEDEIKEEIAEFIKEEMENNPDTMYILGSGSTVQALAKNLGIDGTLLGIDAMYKGELLGKDLNEQKLLTILGEHSNIRLVLSPIGAQGFILGRGNLQLSPAVIRMIGIENIQVISTPAKLADIDSLKVDTNDPELDRAFVNKGWLKVIFGYRQMRLKKVGR